MKKKENKVIILIIIGLIIYLIFSLLLFNKKETETTNYLIINGIENLQYKDNSWEPISEGETDWKKFKIYTNNDYIGTYKVTKANEKYYFFDDNKNSQKIESPFLAISESSDITPINYNVTDVNDDDFNIIKNYLKKEKIDYEGEYSTAVKYITDLNNDKKNDNIYIISNLLYSKETPFFIIFAKCKNKYITILNEIESKTVEIRWILNTKTDNMNDIIINEYIAEKEIIHLYRYHDKEYINIINN